MILCCEVVPPLLDFDIILVQVLVSNTFHNRVNSVAESLYSENSAKQCKTVHSLHRSPDFTLLCLFEKKVHILQRMQQKVHNFLKVFVIKLFVF